MKVKSESDYLFSHAKKGFLATSLGSELLSLYSLYWRLKVLDARNFCDGKEKILSDLSNILKNLKEVSMEIIKVKTVS